MDTSGTRERLIVAMSKALQRRGMNGIGLSELLAEAQAPKGVMYHHFPRGKAQLTVAAIEFTTERMLAVLDKLLARSCDPIDALLAWMTGAQKVLRDSGFEAGCPLATVALESTADDLEIRNALSAGFIAIRGRVAASFVASGFAPGQAQGLAALVVAAYEGGLLQARVERSLKPMRLVGATLIAVLETYRSRMTAG